MNQSEYFEANRPKPKYKFGGRVEDVTGNMQAIAALNLIIKHYGIK